VTIPVEIARELRYELGMVDFIHKRLLLWSVEDEGDLSTGMLSALVESFIAHARLLNEFLGGRPGGRADDVRAVHHLSSWTRAGFLTGEDRTRADKQLLHFTIKRRRRGQWPIKAISRALATTYLEWYDALPDDDRYELEGTAIAARAIIQRCNEDWMHEINLGLVWTEPGDVEEG
jgi:hypothetical protein